jgi:hypothetical protein
MFVLIVPHRVVPVVSKLCIEPSVNRIAHLRRRTPIGHFRAGIDFAKRYGELAVFGASKLSKTRHRFAMNMGRPAEIMLGKRIGNFAQMGPDHRHFVGVTVARFDALDTSCFGFLEYMNRIGEMERHHFGPTRSHGIFPTRGIVRKNRFRRAQRRYQSHTEQQGFHRSSLIAGVE